MTELRNVEADISRFRSRAMAASVIVLICFFLLVLRLHTSESADPDQINQFIFSIE